MTTPRRFDHEKLIVYQRSLHFITRSNSEVRLHEEPLAYRVRQDDRDAEGQIAI
jgi:hypothetical protein